MPRSRARAPQIASSARTWPDLTIEAAWLTGLALVPLLFNPRGWLSFYNDPKYAALHATGAVIVTAWVWERALYRGGIPRPGYGRARAWLGRAPERWAVLAGAALALVATVSTLLSPVRVVSLWGRDYTDLGYELYSVLSLLAVFFAVALRARARAQIRRLLFVFAATGALAAAYGLAQRFGWDPLGPGEDAARIFGSFGNPILFGSFLLMSATITVAFAVGEGEPGRRGWSSGTRWALIGALGLQIAALWFSGSRGPWLGYAAGTLVFAGIAALWLERAAALRVPGVLAAGVAVAVVIAAIPAGNLRGETRGFGDLGGVLDDAGGGALGGREIIWKSALELSTSWDWEPSEGAATRALRPFFGYGPEMFFYAYPLGIAVEPTGTIAAHAHNYLLQLLVELGFLGLLAFVTLAVLVGYIGVRVIWRERAAGRSGGWLALATAGVLAALAGRGLEQMVGIARTGDLLPFWILMGMVLALAAAASSRDEPRAVRETVGRGRRGRRAGAGPSARYGSIGAAIIVTVALAGVLFLRDVQTLRASALARDGDELRAEGRTGEALAKYERAADLAPGVQQYDLEINDLFRKAAAVEEGRGNVDAAVIDWERAREAAQRYADRNPRAFDAIRRLGQAESRLVGLGRAELTASARERYVQLGSSLRSYPGAQTDAAQGLLAIEENELAVVYAGRAIALEPATSPNPLAWWYRGLGQERLGRLDEAIASYEGAIARGPASQTAINSHLGLARIYETRGDSARAREERELASAGR